jgi:hypothetical protein
MRATRLFGLLAALALTTAALAADILDDYQRRYTKTTEPSVKEDVLKALVETGKPEALKALQYCVGVSKSAVEDAIEKLEKARAAVVPIEAKIAKKENDYLEGQKKMGNPNPATRPKFPEDDELLLAASARDNAEKLVYAQKAVLGEALDAHGALAAKLPAQAQKALRDDWTKNRLAAKDWSVRAECYQILGHTPTAWALELLVAAVAGAQMEPDARALVIAVDGLAGRDPATAVPALAARIDDARWLVRVAVVAALENTPSKEAVDAVVARMAKEDGRLKDDCARALRALTGQALPANPEMWRLWWAENRSKWAGKPPAPVEKAPSPFDDAKPVVPAGEDKKTGFFGIEFESRRVVFVIDVSGSMNEAMGGKGPDAKSLKAAVAKAELKRVVAALEDGALFDIVFFSSGVRAWKPEMQKADAKTRKEALDYIDAAEVAGATDTYDALEAAFGLGDIGKGKKREADPTGDARVDTILFLSDGKPSVGRITDPDAIRAAIKDLNRSRRVVLHAVAFGTSASGGADAKFMKGLADDAGGKYVEK